MSLRVVPLAFAGMCLLTACTSDPTKLTQIVVVVDSDLSVPDQLDGLQIEVSGAKQMPAVDSVLDAEHTLPRSLGLVYSGGELGPVRVRARGMLAGEQVVERFADVWFRKDRTLMLALPLTRACADTRPCEDETQTCDLGACVSAEIASLPMFNGDDGPFLMDPEPGFLIDAGTDSGEAELDAGPAHLPMNDAGEDAGAVDTSVVCSITSPEDGASFYKGDSVTFEGGCTAADGGSVGVRWRSSLDTKLGMGTPLTRDNLGIGVHEISLCTKEGSACAESTVQISVEALPGFSATISSLAQVGSSDGEYRADAELIANGEGTGVPPLSYKWIDSFGGEVGNTAVLRFEALPPGRHLLRLLVTDGRNRTASAERGFVVYAPLRDKLFESYSVANALLGSFGTVSALASDGTYHYVGTENGYVVQVSADVAQMVSPSAIATAMTEPRPAVNDLFLHVSADKLYFATSKDVQACNVANATMSGCAKLTLGNFGAVVPHAVRRVKHEGMDYLTVGTSAGLWVGGLSTLDQGSLREENSAFTALTETTDKLWMASSTGLWSYTLGSGGGLSGSPQKSNGASGALNAIVALGDRVWSTLDSGFTCYDADQESWTTLNMMSTGALFGRLVDNEIRSIAITRPVIGDGSHEVIWLATATGLSRFDPAIPSFTTYTKVDGLPDNSVLRVVGLPSNEVLLATPSGLAIHRGQ